MEKRSTRRSRFVLESLEGRQLLSGATEDIPPTMLPPADIPQVPVPPLSVEAPETVAIPVPFVAGGEEGAEPISFPTAPAPSTPDSSVPDDWNGQPLPDNYPFPPLDPVVPGVDANAPVAMPVAAVIPVSTSSTSTDTVQDAALASLATSSAVSTPIAGAITAVAMVGCDTPPQLVDPDGVSIPAPPSSTTNPPDGQVPPSSASPVPTASTQPAPFTVAIAVPMPTYYGSDFA